MKLRRWRRIGLGMVILLGGASLAGWLYTRSPAAARLVGEKLTAGLGTQANVGVVEIGRTETNLHHVRVFEPGSPEGTEPLLTARRVVMKVGSAAAARGVMPDKLKIHDAVVILRYDRNGALLTKFPKGGGTGAIVPWIDFDNTTLVIRQEGRDDSVFTKFVGTAFIEEQRFRIVASCHDPDWGDWQVEGAVAKAGRPAQTLTMTKSLAPAKVTPDLLKRAPFVSPTAWDYVIPTGITPGSLAITIDPIKGRTTYRIDLQPVDTTVIVPSIGLTLTEAAGSVVAEGKTVTLKDVKGKASDGDVRFDSVLEFGGEESRLRFDVDMTGLDVRKLPSGWRVPAHLDGKLTGRVKVNVFLPRAGGTRVEAIGKATVTAAKLGDQPLSPIELDIGTGGDGKLDFLERPGEPAILIAADPKPGPAKVVRMDINLRDAELAEIFASQGVKLSFPVGGTATMKLRLDIPSETSNDVKTYRMSGTATTKQFTVDGMPIGPASATLDLAEGRLTLRDFVGTIPDPQGKPAGAFRATVAVDVEEPHAFSVDGKLSDVNLASLEKLRTLLPERLTLAGTASADVKLGGTLVPRVIVGEGTLSTDKFVLAGVPIEGLKLRWTATDDVLKLRDTTATVFGGSVTGDLDIPLSASATGGSELAVKKVDLDSLSDAILSTANLKLEGTADGRIRVRYPPARAGEERTMTAEIDLEAPTLKLQGVTAKKIKATAKFAGERLRYTVVGDALGGQLEVEGAFPPEDEPPPKRPPVMSDIASRFGRLRLRGVLLSALGEVVGSKGAFGPLDAAISGELPLATDLAGRLVGNGRLRAERLTWNGKAVSGTGESLVRLDGRSWAFDDLTVFIGEGVARARVKIDRVDPDRSTATISLTNIPSTRLLFMAPDLAAKIDMPVDGRFTTTMGREWRGSGVLTAVKGSVAGVPMTDVRMPIDWIAVPSQGRSQYRVRDATATTAAGQISGRAEARLYRDVPPRVSGDVQFRNVNLSRAFKNGNSLVGNLLVTGKFDFAAEQFRTVDDLTGRLEAKLGESQPFALPVLSSIAPFLGVTATAASSTTREGEVRAALGKGIWRIQRFTLTGSSVDLYAEGYVSTAGRIDLDVTASTKQRPAQALIRRLMPASVISAGPGVPIAGTQLTDTLRLIGNYVIYLDVSGTTSSPIVRLETVRTVSEAAARFFLFRFLAPFPGADVLPSLR